MIRKVICRPLVVLDDRARAWVPTVVIGVWVGTMPATKSKTPPKTSGAAA